MRDRAKSFVEFVACYLLLNVDDVLDDHLLKFLDRTDAEDLPDLNDNMLSAHQQPIVPIVKERQNRGVNTHTDHTHTSSHSHRSVNITFITLTLIFS